MPRVFCVEVRAEEEYIDRKISVICRVRKESACCVVYQLLVVNLLARRLPLTQHSEFYPSYQKRVWRVDTKQLCQANNGKVFSQLV